MNNDQKFKIVSVILIAGFLLVLIGKYWMADYHYQKGVTEARQGQYESAVKDIQIAIDYSPTEAIYHNQMARIFTDLELAPYAISESNIAYNLNPRNMNILQTRISMYLQLAKFNPEYLQLAVNLIKDTIPLSPTDPKLRLLLGKAYANIGQIENSKEAINKALELKPDYTEAKKDLEIILKIPKK